MPGSEPLSNAKLDQKLTELRMAFEHGTPPENPQAKKQFNGRIQAKANNLEFINVFLTFDEAHTLSDAISKGTNKSNYTVLRQVLHFLSHCHFYVFFLSTTGKITKFAQPYRQDASNHINYSEFSTPLPYISLALIS